VRLSFRRMGEPRLGRCGDSLGACANGTCRWRLQGVGRETPYSQWLPSLSDRMGVEEGNSERRPFEPWLVRLIANLASISMTGSEHVLSPQNEAMRSHREKNWVLTSDPFQRTWLTPRRAAAFRSEAWGKRLGYGRHEKLKARSGFSARSRFCFVCCLPSGRPRVVDQASF